MKRPSRRTVLQSTAGAVALSAGCIADENGESPDEGDADDGSQPDDGSEGDPGDEPDPLPDGLASYETETYQYPTESSTGAVAVVRDSADAADWLEARSLSETDPVAGFVDDTDFERSILVSLESEAPNSCYEMLLESIDIEAIDDGGEELVLEGAVRDTSADDEACAMSITTVGRLVRATFESEPLTALSATIVDHDGSTTGVSMRSDSASASESTSAESASGSGNDSQSDDRS